jgi:hypothetical protein
LLAGSLPILMHLFMARNTEGDQVGFAVIAAVAAKILVVNLQMQSSAAQLASPSRHAAEFPAAADGTVRYRDVIAAAWVEPD